MEAHGQSASAGLPQPRPVAGRPSAFTPVRNRPVCGVALGRRGRDRTAESTRRLDAVVSSEQPLEEEAEGALHPLGVHALLGWQRAVKGRAEVESFAVADDPLATLPPSSPPKASVAATPILWQMRVAPAPRRRRLCHHRLAARGYCARIRSMRESPA